MVFATGQVGRLKACLTVWGSAYAWLDRFHAECPRVGGRETGLGFVFGKQFFTPTILVRVTLL